MERRRTAPPTRRRASWASPCPCWRRPSPPGAALWPCSSPATLEWTSHLAQPGRPVPLPLAAAVLPHPAPALGAGSLFHCGPRRRRRPSLRSQERARRAGSHARRCGARSCSPCASWGWSTHAGDRNGFLASSRPESGVEAWTSADGYATVLDGIPAQGDGLFLLPLLKTFLDEGPPGPERVRPPGRPPLPGRPPAAPLRHLLGLRRAQPPGLVGGRPGGVVAGCQALAGDASPLDRFLSRRHRAGVRLHGRRPAAPRRRLRGLRPAPRPGRRPRPVAASPSGCGGGQG